MKMLVTGAAGFIGSNFVRYMLEKDYFSWQIVAFDALTYAGRADNIPEFVPFIHGDVAGPEIEQAIDKFAPSVIVHFAAESHVDRSIVDASDFVDTNIVGTYRILDACRRVGSALIHVSTDEVYGSVPYGYTKEDAPLNPTNPYAASKAAADLLVLSYIKTHGMRALITRCTNNYGPRQFPEKFIPLCITNAFQERPLPVYGDGENVRDWIHVSDHCAAIKAILDSGRWGEIFHIGANQTVSNNGIASRICHALDRPESDIQYVPDRKAHDKRYALDTGKIRELGWTPKYKIDAGLQSTINWYRMNEAWWKKSDSDGDERTAT